MNETSKHTKDYGMFLEHIKQDDAIRENVYLDSTSYNNCTPSMKAYAIDIEKLYNDQLELLELNKNNSKLFYFPVTMISIIVISLFIFIGYLYYQIFFNGQ